MEEAKKLKTNLKCPKCKSKRLSLIEITNALNTFFVDDGYVDMDGSKEFGDTYKLQGNCRDCDYMWKIRNVIQITDVIEE